ncbi:hypothetical protein N665_0939s0005 [Sinapis alba]|nr:hypothetical protein N665_0939s0005 [Sinapis alba]
MPEIFKEIGEKLGAVRAVDANTARVQVTVNVDAPLKFARKSRLPSGEIVKLELKYERLSRWCFNCGHISHEERTCPSLTETQRRERRATDSLPKGEHRSSVVLRENPHGSHHNLRKPERRSLSLTDRKDRENVQKRLDSSGLERKDKLGADRVGYNYSKDHSSRFSEASYRKRSYKDSFAAKKGRVPPSKEPHPEPLLGSIKALETGPAKPPISPKLQAPFRLNLHKKAFASDKGKAIEMDDSVDSGSSAKKGLNFEIPNLIPVEAETLTFLEKASVGFVPFDPEKSWYDIVMEGVLELPLLDDGVAVSGDLAGQLPEGGG